MPKPLTDPELAATVSHYFGDIVARYGIKNARRITIDIRKRIQAQIKRNKSHKKFSKV